MSSPAYRLVRRPASAVRTPVLDAAQQAVVAHACGPLLVVAGPGTGKTTTLVEAVVARIAAGADPERVLVLTFSRKAAAELRERVTGRLGRTLREPLARTFHSYAFGLLRREAVLQGEPVPRLLSGPEQDVVIRELLRGEVAGDAPASGWPEAVRAGLLTRGFAQELRDLLMRAGERGIDARGLDRLGRRHDRPEWRAAARFLRQYAAVSALAEPAAFDPAELVRVVLDRGLVDAQRGAHDWVYVDEYQDCDPLQEELLRRLVPPGGNVVAVGDPNQSIYGFRGADPSCLSRFPEAFAGLDGAPTPVVRLQTSRRSAPRVVAAGEAVARRLRWVHAGIPSSPRRRSDAAPGLVAAAVDGAPGSVDVLLAPSEAHEASLVAGVLRRAHVVDGIPWGAMAVLVRSAGPLPALRRALLAAGVPMRSDAHDVPLAAQPGLRPLLDVLRVAVRPESLDEETAVALLTSPLGGLDPVALRRLRRELRHLELAGGGSAPSSALVVSALLDPRLLVPVSDALGRPAQRVAELIARTAAAAARPGATVEAVLWELWQASGLGPRWQAASADGGVTGSMADRDLDAAMTLFDAAARFVDRLPRAGLEVFLEHVASQEIAGDSLAPRAPGDDTVQLLTAHAAKGLEWELVVVAGVQEGRWPDLRPRGSVLRSEQLVEVAAPGSRGAVTIGRLLDEERRLFYVAMTRARSRLVVTAVTDPDEGEQPSRFLADVPLADDDDLAVAEAEGGAGDPRVAGTTLGELRRACALPVLLPRLRQVAVDPAQPIGTRTRAGALARQLGAVARSLDLSSTVADLRAVVCDPAAVEQLRLAAATQLARLARAGVPGADPDDWHGMSPLSDDGPLHAPGDLVPVSPSRVDLFSTCRLRWLLESVGGADAGTPSSNVGTLVHALAAAVRADEGKRPEALAELGRELERRWPELDLAPAWFSRQQRVRAEGMLRRFTEWGGRQDRDLVGTEVEFSAELPAGPVTARIAGRVDRLERDIEGRAYVVDLKTGSSKPRDEELATHPQLAVYQLAAELGAFREHGAQGSGGASLLQLGKAAGAGVREQRQAPLSEADNPEWARRLVAETAEGMAGAVFAARENAHCDRCPVRTSCPLQDEGGQVVGR